MLCVSGVVRLVERDRLVLWELERWRVMRAKEIKVLGGFNGDRVMYRRLRLLIDYGYLERKRYIYGMAGIYTITNKGRKELQLPLKNQKVSIALIEHDLAVVDSYIYFKKRFSLDRKQVTSEKELREDFKPGTHYPDFVFAIDDKTYCVEVEFTLKNKTRLENNIKSNYLKYDTQYWIIKKDSVRLMKLLQVFEETYPNIEILYWEDICLC